MKTEEYRIAERLPTSLSRTNLVDVAKVIDGQLYNLDSKAMLVLLYPRIDELSSELVDALAIALHVDYYDKDLPLEKRRLLVKNSTRWHMRKGTKGVVQEMVATVWDGCNVEEWFEYEGEPYHFRVVNVTATHVDEEVIRQVLRAIWATKNARSWLDGINFLRKLNAMIYFGGIPCTHKRVGVRPARPMDADITAVGYLGASLSMYKRVSAGAKKTW